MFSREGAGQATASPIPGRPGALCQWQGCQFSNYKSMNPQNDFETLILREKKYILLCFNISIIMLSSYFEK